MNVQRQPGIPVILVTVFLDTLAFGFVIPVLPAPVATMTPDKQSQAYWYGLLLGSFGGQCIPVACRKCDEKPGERAFLHESPAGHAEPRLDVTRSLI